MSTTTSPYDSIAEWYAERCDDPGPVDEMLYSAILSVCPPLDGASVCDFACGAGHSSRLIAERGAVVTGIDVSAEMIRIAQTREAVAPLGINYRVGDLTSANTFHGERYDGILCSEGMMAIPDLAAVLDVARRFLHDSGWLVFSVTHPCFVNPAATSTEDTRRIGRYFDEGPWRSGDDSDAVQYRVPDYHHTLATYLNALHHAGFVVEEAVEPRLAPDLAPGSWLTNVPGYLVLRCGVR
jgi:SAM-dependent methyltransferase